MKRLKIYVEQRLNRIIEFIELRVMKYYHKESFIKTFEKIINEERPFLMKPSELYLLYAFAKMQKNIEGDYAEVGVYKGTSAKAICEAKGLKKLYLFDTFEGLPEVEDKRFKKGMFKANLENVKNKLFLFNLSSDNIFIFEGLFPKHTGHWIKNKKFAFVHLDVDIYKSTKDSLEFFYKRMNKGGIIISHDYHTEGVRKAFDEFFKDKKEEVIQLPMSQCMIVKN